MIWLFKDSMSATDADQLRKDFKKMDADGDGKITLKEFQQFMKKEMKSPKTDNEIANTFKRLDIDGDETLCFKELLNSVADVQMREVPERMWKVFSKIDDD